MYILAMVTKLFLDITVSLTDNFITLEDDWLKSTPEILVF